MQKQRKDQNLHLRASREMVAQVNNLAGKLSRELGMSVSKSQALEKAVSEALRRREGEQAQVVA